MIPHLSLKQANERSPGNSRRTKDYSEAAKWYRKAADQGHAGAQLYLGILLAQGQGVEQDVVEAYKWLELAKQGSFMDRRAAKECQGKLLAFMEPAQIVVGGQYARAFRPTKKPHTTL